MFGIGLWELLLIFCCLAAPAIIGLTVAVVLLATKRESNDK